MVATRYEGNRWRRSMAARAASVPHLFLEGAKWYGAPVHPKRYAGLWSSGIISTATRGEQRYAGD
jgi:hypothetical protein